MSTYMQAHLKRAYMWTRKHVYVSAYVGAKKDWVSVCLCIHPSIRLSIGMYLNIYIWMLLSATMSNVCVSVRLSVCQPVCMPMCKFLCLTICSSVHPCICIRECLFQSVNVSDWWQGLNYLSVLLYDCQYAHPCKCTCNYTVLCIFLFFCQPDRILSAYVSVRLFRVSPPVCVFK